MENLEILRPVGKYMYIPAKTVGNLFRKSTMPNPSQVDWNNIQRRATRSGFI